MPSHLAHVGMLRRMLTQVLTHQCGEVVVADHGRQLRKVIPQRVHQAPKIHVGINSKPLIEESQPRTGFDVLWVGDQAEEGGLSFGQRHATSRAACAPTKMLLISRRIPQSARLATSPRNSHSVIVDSLNEM